MKRLDLVRGALARRSPALMLTLALSLATLPARAEPTSIPVPAAVKLAQGSELWLEGTSTVHEYQSRTSELALVLLRDAAAPDPADVAALGAWLRSGNLRGLDLGVPLAPMRSGKAALDKNLLKALRASEFPEIRFKLTQSRIGAESGDTVAVTAEGVLRVAGRERPITVAGRLVKAEAGVWLEGRHALKMTEYDVKPPTMMLGTLRVHDPVVVHFRLLLAPGAPAGAVNAESRH